VLRLAPYSLPWGSNVYAKVIAYNSYGDSQESESGFEAIILTVPSAPFGLQEVTAMRTDNSITFEWSPSLADGGAPILDYKLTYDQATNNWIELDPAVTET
jgi:hypothetical protein